MVELRLPTTPLLPSQSSCLVIILPGPMVTNDRQGWEDPWLYKRRLSYRFVLKQGRNFSYNELFWPTKGGFCFVLYFSPLYVSTIELKHILLLKSKIFLSAFYFETNFSKNHVAVYNILLYLWQVKYDIVLLSKVSASIYWIRYFFPEDNLVLWLLFHTSNLFIISVIRTTFITDYILSWDNIYKKILLGKWILWSKLKDKWQDMQKKTFVTCNDQC